MSLNAPQSAGMRRKSVYGVAAAALVVFVGLGVFAKNGWLPHTDPLTGKKSGWFGQDLPKNAGSTWNPLAAPSPTPTPQLSKEYIYAGSRLLAVEDANANAAPPADIGVWRPSTGVWYVLSAQSQVTIASWGGDPTDVPVQGDYDGDGKTDFAIYRKSNRTYYILRTSDNGVTITAWGNDDHDKPVTGDFDGDGKTDIAVFRDNTGDWYILRSSDSQVTIASWGASGDKSAAADYDGDGKADLAVWRPSTLSFYAYSLVTGQVLQANFSGASSGDQPVCADYDGDGKADFAIQSGNTWRIVPSQTPQTPQSVTWGNTGDKAVQNDYDGDGKVDIAVWRPADSPTGTLGHWYIRQSSHLGQSNELRDENWGTTADIPVPAFYRR